MGSNLDCEGLGRFATAPQSRDIMPTKQFYVQRMVPLRTEHEGRAKPAMWLNAFRLRSLYVVSRDMTLASGNNRPHDTVFSGGCRRRPRCRRTIFMIATRPTCSLPAPETQRPVEIGRANILEERRRIEGQQNLIARLERA
jgi:hypothetical protein